MSNIRFKAIAIFVFLMLAVAALGAAYINLTQPATVSPEVVELYILNETGDADLARSTARICEQVACYFDEDNNINYGK